MEPAKIPAFDRIDKPIRETLQKNERISNVDLTNAVRFFRRPVSDACKRWTRQAWVGSNAGLCCDR
jgi:hypothetical protein